ncbi:MAG: hypothetical protein ACLPY5_04145 [Candidatus Bathyarchaeia archaeon]
MRGQLKTSEAIDLSLQVEFESLQSPRIIVINTKNEGKGIAHTPVFNWHVIDPSGTRIYSGKKELQSIGPASKQDVRIDFPTDAVPKGSTFHVDWEAKASDGRTYKAPFKIVVNEIHFREQDTRPQTGYQSNLLTAPLQKIYENLALGRRLSPEATDIFTREIENVGLLGILNKDAPDLVSSMKQLKSLVETLQGQGYTQQDARKLLGDASFDADEQHDNMATRHLMCLSQE